MAKMFYTMDETRAALGRNEEEIKQLTREGRLREYRDGARLMYKAEQVEQLKGELGGGAPAGAEGVQLPTAESGAPIGLGDSKGGSGSVIGLADSVKDDTALAADVGGSVGGVPSPGRSGTRTGTGTGITVFGSEDAERADPSAQTAVSQGQQDQVNLDQVGSGSGLLDLTRESDDTSLGAELLDEIKPGKQRPRAPESAETQEATLANVESAVVRTPAATAPVEIERPDPMAPALAGASIAASLVLLFAGLVLCCAMVGFKPGFLDSVAAARGALVLAAMGLVPVVLLFVAGLFVGKAR